VGEGALLHQSLVLQARPPLLHLVGGNHRGGRGDDLRDRGAHGDHGDDLRDRDGLHDHGALHDDDGAPQEAARQRSSHPETPTNHQNQQCF